MGEDGDREVRGRSSLSPAGDSGVFRGCFYSSCTDQFTVSSVSSCHYAVFLSFPLDGLIDLDSEEEDDEDANIASDREQRIHVKRFIQDIQAHKSGG